MPSISFDQSTPGLVRLLREFSSDVDILTTLPKGGASDSRTEMATHIQGSEGHGEVIDDMKQIHDERSLSNSLSANSESHSCEKEADIRNILGKILSTEWICPDMAFAEHIETPINPGLFVTGAETIGLPLSYRDASALFDICDELERSSDETVGEKVRTAWTLPPSLMRFQNPIFRAWVVEATKKAIAGLRISGRIKSGNIKVHLSGMVLQPPCASNESLRL